jgi:hypothetical protein
MLYVTHLLQVCTYLQLLIKYSMIRRYVTFLSHSPVGIWYVFDSLSQNCDWIIFILSKVFANSIFNWDSIDFVEKLF